MHQMECVRPHCSCDCNGIEGKYRKLRVSSDYRFVQSFRVAEICWIFMVFVTKCTIIITVSMPDSLKLPLVYVLDALLHLIPLIIQI